MKISTIPKSALFLLVFAVTGAGLVSMVWELTRDRIAHNEQAALLRSLRELVPDGAHDNDLLSDTITVTDRSLLGTPAPVTVYRARMAGQSVAAVFSPVAPDGYNGNIRLLVGIQVDGTLAGVRTISHRETPGLGDDISQDRSDWILGFQGLSIGNPPRDKWKVRKDGGQFDQFTGATISPRAVVKAIYNSLVYFEDHREDIFRPAVAAGEAQGTIDR